MLSFITKIFKDDEKEYENSLQHYQPPPLPGFVSFWQLTTAACHNTGMYITRPRVHQLSFKVYNITVIVNRTRQSTHIACSTFKCYDGISLLNFLSKFFYHNCITTPKCSKMNVKVKRRKREKDVSIGTETNQRSHYKLRQSAYTTVAQNSLFKYLTWCSHNIHNFYKTFFRH